MHVCMLVFQKWILLWQKVTAVYHRKWIQQHLSKHYYGFLSLPSTVNLTDKVDQPYHWASSITRATKFESSNFLYVEFFHLRICNYCLNWTQMYYARLCHWMLCQIKHLCLLAQLKVCIVLLSHLQPDKELIPSIVLIPPIVPLYWLTVYFHIQH